MTTLTEADVEQAALDWLSALGWKVAHGPDIAPGTHNAERSDYGQVVLECRVRDSLAELNPSLLPSALDDAYRKLTRPEGSTLGNTQPRLPPDARRWRDGRASG